MTKYWIITQIITKCPKCGKEYRDEGEYAQNIFRGEIGCINCDFVGEVGEV